MPTCWVPTGQPVPPPRPLPHINAPAHRLELEPLLNQYEHERSKAKEQRREDWEWERYLACSHVPHPKDRIAMSDFLALMGDKSDTLLSESHSAGQVGKGQARWGKGLVGIATMATVLILAAPLSASGKRGSLPPPSPLPL